MHDLQHGGTTVEVEASHFVHAKHALGEAALIELSSSELHKGDPPPNLADQNLGLLGSDSYAEDSVGAEAGPENHQQPTAVAVSSNPQPSVGPTPIQPTNPLTVSEVTDAVDANIDDRLGRQNHFQDFLKSQPIVKDALEKYKDGVADVKNSAGNVYEGMGGLVDGMSRLHNEVGGVEKETGNLKLAMEAERRESATNSVGAFTTYNHEGVFGSDDTGRWKPDAGKWDAF